MPRKTRREELKDNVIKALEAYIAYERQDAVRDFDTRLRQNLNLIAKGGSHGPPPEESTE